MPDLAYYKLYFDDSDGNAAVCDKYELNGADRFSVAESIEISDWPTDVTLFHSGGPKEDYLGNALGWHVVSARVRKIVSNQGIEAVQFLPMKVVDSGSGATSFDYSVMNILCMLPALHRSESLYREFAEPPYFTVIKPVLDRRIVRSAPIFRLTESKMQVYVSEVLKAAIEGIDATGFRFIPVKVAE